MGNYLISQELSFSAGDDSSFGLMFNNHAAIMLLIEPETGLILEVNSAAVKFYGYPKLKLSGMPFAEINCLDDGQAAIQRQKAKDEGRIYLVFEHRLSNGQVRTVEELSSTLVWQGKPILFLIVHDITGSAQLSTNPELVLQAEVRRRETALEDLSIHKIELEMQNEELRRIQIELEIARSRYFDLFDMAPVGYCTISQKDMITETNLTAASLLGITRSAMLKKQFHSFVLPDCQSAYIQYRRQLFETGRSQTLDVQMLKKDGPQFWAHLQAIIKPAPLTGSEQDVEGPTAAWIVISDISERKRMEKTLRENKEQLVFQNQEKEKRAAELVVANLELAYQNEEKEKRADELVIANLELAYQNKEKEKRAAELVIANLELAYQNEEKIKRAAELIIAKELGFQNEEKAKWAAELIIANTELVFQNEEKAKRAAELVIANIELVFQNEEKAKRAAELALANSYLENLIDYANAPIIVWDPQFRITRFNHAFEFLTGRSEADVLGQSLEILFPAAHVKKTMGQIGKTLIGERWKAVEIKILHRDGSIRTVLWNSATLFEPDGKKALATIAQGQDITERKRAEQALQAAHDVLELRVMERTADLQESNAALKVASKSKDDFMAIISHELRTPLTGILGISQALQITSQDELNLKQVTAIQSIEKSGLHLLDLINQILDFSKIQAGKLVLQKEACSLDNICQASMQLVNSLVVKKEQHLSFKSLSENIILRVDELRLRQVIVNLLSNAIKFTPDGGSIELSVTGQPDSHQVVIVVRDSGIGIKEEDLHRLFEPFVQLDMGHTRKYKGTGLGLAIVKQIVELHAGSVAVESDFGAGSRFSVILPWE